MALAAFQLGGVSKLWSSFQGLVRPKGFKDSKNPVHGERVNAGGEVLERALFEVCGAEGKKPGRKKKPFAPLSSLILEQEPLLHSSDSFAATPSGADTKV